MNKLIAPFPYFGGKSKIGHIVWEIFGDVDNFIDPFMGSLAILLARPEWHKGRTETVNDMDCFLANFWRAVKSDPESVAMYADWPVNECDLVSRHRWLRETGSCIVAECKNDPDFFSSQVAGWWVWGINAWIGDGWCQEDSDQKLPHLGNAGRGINKLPHLGNAGRGETRTKIILDYMLVLQNRLRDVRVCCGDWRRVVTNGAMSYGNNMGVLLDPPYVQVGRDNVYNHEGSDALHKDIISWCKIYEHNPKIKIILCGYEGSYPELSWKQIPWKAGRAYGNSQCITRNNDNRMKERLWVSPNCKIQERLF